MSPRTVGSDDQQTIVVCGATGQQGSWVLKSLAALRKFRLVAFSRTPDSDKARSLKARGFVVEKADLADRESLRRIFTGAYGVFGVTQPWTADYKRADGAAEVKQGKNLIDACASSKVAHLVLPTVMRTDETRTGLSHVDSKLEIERYLKMQGVPHTLLRPGTFMDNIGRAFFPVKRGKVRGFADGDAKMPFVACRDIGEAAAAVLDAPEKWLGKVVTLIGDYASGDDLCSTLGRLRSERFEYRAPPALLMRVLVPEFYKMRRGLEQAGRAPFPHQAVIERSLSQTRTLVSDSWDLEAYLKASGIVERRL